MIKIAKTIYKNSILVLNNGNYLLIFLISSLLFLLLLLFLPVFTIPGNSILFQLSIFKPTDYLLMLFLSFSTGLLISMQVYNFKLMRSVTGSGKGVIGVFSGFIAGIFGTAACPSCVMTLLGFLGAGTTIFLLQYQKYVLSIAIFLVLLSLYMVSRGMENECEKCKSNVG